MDDTHKSQLQNIIDELLVDCPPVLTVQDLARVAGWTPQRVYVLAVRANKGEHGLLPPALKTPNSNLLRFPKSGVRQWFVDASVNPKPSEKKKSPGRPRGSTSRRGIARAELEGSV